MRAYIKSGIYGLIQQMKPFTGSVHRSYMSPDTYRSKVSDRSSPHKRIGMREVKQVVVGLPHKSSFLNGEPKSEDLCFSFICRTGDTIDIRVCCSLSSNAT